MIQKPFFLTIITVAAMLYISSSAVADSLAQSNRPEQNDQLQSLSAPSSDYPAEQGEHRDVKEGNLSSPPPVDPSTNNAPFDEKEINSSSTGQKKPN